MRCTENCLNFWAQPVVIRGMNSIWRPVNAGVSQGPILCSAMLNTFINDLDGRVPKYTSSKFPGSTKLRVVTDIPNRQVVIQRDLDRVKKWTNRNLIKINSGKCIALPLENSPVHQYRLETNCVGSSFAEKAWISRWTPRCP